MNRPFVFINAAVTADGKIDTRERRGATISSARDKARVDRLRAGADAVMVGGKTLVEENPRLTVKSEALRAERAARGLSPNPMKVGIVSNADELPDGDFVNFGAARVVIFAAERTSKARVESLRLRGVEVYVHDAPRVDLVEALRVLRGLGVERLMVEGGGTLNFELLRLGLVDELTIYVAPMIFGGESAPTLADGVGLARGEAIPLKLVESEIHADGGVVLKYARATGVL